MLRLCLESLLASERIETEIVVVNNGCEEELPELAARSPRVHEVRSTVPLGFSAANNLGVRWADEELGPSDLYYFVNNDTWSEPAALADQVAVLTARPECAVVGPRLVIWGAEGHLNSLGINVTRDAWGWDEGIGRTERAYGALPGERSVLAVTGSALLMRAPLFHQVAGWSELYDYYFEDIDLCLKARRAGHNVVQVPQAVVRHGISATMTEGSDRKDRLFWRNRLLLGFAHWPLALWSELLGRAVGRDLLLCPPEFRARPRGALIAALQRFPRAWKLRCDSPTGPRARDWVRFLRPVGSVPRITLPEVCYLPLEQRISADDLAPASQSTELGREAGEWRARTGRRILVLGWAPLPFDEAQMNYAPGVRAWQLARSLAEDGHRVLLATALMPGAGAGGEEPSGVESYHEGVRIQTFSWDRFEEPGVLEAIADRFAPELLVGATPLPSRRAVELAGGLPLWIDLFGDPMSEAQAKAGVSDGDHIDAYRRLLARLLARGDAFSAVSDRQKWSAVGQLGLAGRLSGAVAGRELVFTIPCSSQSVVWSEPTALPAGVVEPHHFVVLWSGGYNTWCDVETLCAGLEGAMAEAPELHFVSTGGVIEGHDEGTYPRFRELVATSDHAARYHLLGRRPKSEADAWVRRADLGVVTEKSIYERSLGSSQRLAGWLGAGLPFVCTPATELAVTAGRAGCCFLYEPGDATGLSDQILRRVRSRDDLESAARSCAAWIESEGSDRRQTEPLRRWAHTAQPTPAAAAPDAVESLSHLLEEPEQLRRELKTMYEQLRGTHRALEATREHEVWLTSELERFREFERLYHETRSELGRIHESRMWELWMRYLDLRAKLPVGRK